MDAVVGGNRTVGQAFRQRRRELRLTQADIARRLATTQSYVGGVERSDRDVRWATVLEMARALELEVMLVPRDRIGAVEAAISLAPDDEVPPLVGGAW
jgi:predicted transcriptional regulator